MQSPKAVTRPGAATLWPVLGLHLGHLHSPRTLTCPSVKWASWVAQMVKNLPQCRRPGFDPWVRKIPWRRAWQLTPVFLPGEFHGQRSLGGYSPRGHKELDRTERLTQHNKSGFNMQWSEDEWVGRVMRLRGKNCRPGTLAPFWSSYGHGICPVAVVAAGLRWELCVL